MVAELPANLYDTRMERSPQSHKGENGVVAIVGGSRWMHGAPLLSALAAQASGVDLLYLFVPACHEEVSKATALNFQVRAFAGNDLRERDTEAILERLASVDCAIIGPGIAHGDEDAVEAICALIEGAACPLVLDAAALQPTTLGLLGKTPTVLTPHLGELERMNIAPEDLGTAAKQAKTTIFLKGPIDRIAAPDGHIQTIAGGNAGLTVGGTGDTLAGLIGGFIAQQMEPVPACMLAGKLMKRAAEELYAKQWFSYTATDVIAQIPHLLHDVDSLHA
jgi:NAD(P)H-hydrate epimerase